MRRQCKTLALMRPYTASMVRRGGHRKPSSMAERADGWGGAGSGGRARAGRGGEGRHSIRRGYSCSADPVPDVVVTLARAASSAIVGVAKLQLRGT